MAIEHTIQRGLGAIALAAGVFLPAREFLEKPNSTSALIASGFIAVGLILLLVGGKEPGTLPGRPIMDDQQLRRRRKHHRDVTGD